jgi:hypothetical protein
MKNRDIFFRKTGGIVLEVLSIAPLRRAGLRCAASILRNFFFLQYYAVLFPKRIPVSRVDHPLDETIPFDPARVRTYLTFVAFWIRLLGFLLSRYGRDGRDMALEFIRSMDDLYRFAARIYKKHLSTTTRPRYKKGRFRLIHMTDPHLMCIPSLHVMIVIHTYTMLREFLSRRGETELYAQKAEAVRRGALAITESVLFVKQHSVNCISASLYAMCRFSPFRFPPGEAEQFAGDLFAGRSFDEANPPDPPEKRPEPSPGDRESIVKHITDLYRSFLEAGKTSEDWEKPLLDFLETHPR